MYMRCVESTNHLIVWHIRDVFSTVCSAAFDYIPSKSSADCKISYAHTWPDHCQCEVKCLLENIHNSMTHTVTRHHTHSPTHHLPPADAHLNRRSSVGQKRSTQSPVVPVTFDLGLGEQHQLNCSSEGPGKRHRTEDWGKYTEWHWYDRLQCFVTVIFYILTQRNKSSLHDVLDLMSCPFGLVTKPLAWTGDAKGNVQWGSSAVSIVPLSSFSQCVCCYTASQF